MTGIHFLEAFKDRIGTEVFLKWFFFLINFKNKNLKFAQNLIVKKNNGCNKKVNAINTTDLI